MCRDPLHSPIARRALRGLKRCEIARGWLGFDGALECAGQMPSDFAVRAGADTDVIPELPVIEVVPTARAAARIGGDLILFEASAAMSKPDTSFCMREALILVREGRRPRL